MLKRISPGEAISDDGFGIKLGHRHIIYYEDNKTMGIGAEPDKDLSCTIVFTNSIKKWNPPFDSEVVTPKKKLEITKRVAGALTFLGIKHRMY